MFEGDSVKGIMEQAGLEIMNVVNDVAIFLAFSREEMEILIPYLEPRHFSKGCTLFREGEPGDFICFIRSGKMEIKKEAGFKGKQVILAVLSQGSFVGELSIIDGKPRSATVVTLEDTDTLILKADHFEEITRMHPLIGFKLLREIARVLSIRLRKSADRLTTIF